MNTDKYEPRMNTDKYKPRMNTARIPDNGSWTTEDISAIPGNDGFLAATVGFGTGSRWPHQVLNRRTHRRHSPISRRRFDAQASSSVRSSGGFRFGRAG